MKYEVTVEKQMVATDNIIFLQALEYCEHDILSVQLLHQLGR